MNAVENLRPRIGNTLKVFVTGSNHFNKEAPEKEREKNWQILCQASDQVGQALAKRGHTVLLGTDNKNCVDLYVLEGIAAVEGSVTTIEVHHPDDGHIRFAPETLPERIKKNPQLIRHVYHLSSMWKAVHMEAISTCDAVIIIGGGSSSLLAGIAANLLGKTVIPIENLGGSGRDVWKYSSAKRQEFYTDLTKDEDIDQLVATWKGDTSAEFVVNLLESVAKNRTKMHMSKLLIALTAIVMFLGLLLASLGNRQDRCK